MTEKVDEDNIRTFTVKSLYDGVEEYTIGKINKKNGSKDIYKESFSSGMVSILDKSLKDRDAIVLDELGFMENNIDKFTSKVYELLDSNKIVLGVLKDFNCNFLNNIRARNDVIIVEITKENRDFVIKNILDILKSFNIPFKKETSFQWTPKRINWYNKALDHPHSHYPDSFIKEIKKHTGNLKDKTVLDIGAGTGAFAIPFMKEGAYITAVDPSLNMINSLTNRAKLHNLNNFNCIISPFHRSNPSKHDIAISAFSGGGTKSKEGIKKMHSLVREYSFIISSFENQQSNFKSDILYKMLNKSPRRKKTRKNTLSSTLSILDSLGYKYKCKEIEYEFSQYFHSFNEGMEFFIDKFSIENFDEIQIIENFLNKFLIKENNYLVFENIKKSWLIVIHK
ncbi:MAG TPA: nucleoside-triphosphatase [Tissierellales bacterium]|nr:nucleoside-triphosphatase [Tissierellales bacterium]